MRRFHDLEGVEKRGCKVLVEEKSTNCFLNAVESRRVLEEGKVDVRGWKTCVVMQDSTMARRTKMSFEAVFGDLECVIYSYPGFVPAVRGGADGFEFEVEHGSGVGQEALWGKQRFLDLVLGEIPRLRDDEKGYGPKGTGSIAHVDIPMGVEEAWGRLREVVVSNR